MHAQSRQPIDTHEYNAKQTNYQIVGTLQIRSIDLGPAISGKPLLLQI